MPDALTPMAPGKVKLLPGLFQDRFALNRKYMLSLHTENLLQNVLECDDAYNSSELVNYQGHVNAASAELLDHLADRFRLRHNGRRTQQGAKAGFERG